MRYVELAEIGPIIRDQAIHGESVTKVELLQHYAEAPEHTVSRLILELGNPKWALEAFIKTRSEWAPICAKARQGRDPITRLHFVERPYTPHLAWEIQIGYQAIAAYGAEKILLADRADIKGNVLPVGWYVTEEGLALRKGDFWRWDEQALQMFYEPESHNFLGGFLYEPGDDISQLVEAEQALLAVAYPFDQQSRHQ